MTRVVHHQCTLLHLLLDESRHIRIRISCRRSHSRIGIPHDTLHHQVRIQLLNGFSYGVCIVHMRILITVVAHEADDILPDTSLFILDITFYLVDCYLGLVCRTR